MVILGTGVRKDVHMVTVATLIKVWEITKMSTSTMNVI